MISTRMKPDVLSRWCRMLRVSHDGGIGLADTFRQQGRRGPGEVRPLSAAVGDDLAAGQSLEDALKPHGGQLPKLFVKLAVVGERSGHLPEVFRELERYYDLEWQLVRQFRQQIAWPVFQLVAAVFVIAGLIAILGWITPAGGKPLDPLGLGLTGTAGALTFLFIVASVAVLAWLTYRFLRDRVVVMAAAERQLLQLPWIGPALEAVWLARFCLALRLTAGAGLPLKSAARDSLEATGSAAFAKSGNDVVAVIKQGDALPEALTAARLFPSEFVDVVANADETGQVPEVMARQAEHYFDEARRRMTALTAAAGWAVYLGVAIIIIAAIFRIYTTAILSAYNI